MARTSADAGRWISYLERSNGIDIQAEARGSLAYVSVAGARGRTLDEACANARYLAAAWNACADAELSVEDLEAGLIEEFKADSVELRELNSCLDQLNIPGTEDDHPSNRVGPEVRRVCEINARLVEALTIVRNQGLQGEIENGLPVWHFVDSVLARINRETPL